MALEVFYVVEGVLSILCNMMAKDVSQSDTSFKYVTYVSH